VKLVIRDAQGTIGTYSQAVNVGGSKDAAPAVPTCGHLTTAEANDVLRANGLPVAGTGSPLALPSNRKCVDTRRFSFRIHQHRKRITRVRAYVNGKLIARLHGRRIGRVTIRRLPQGQFQLKIVAVTSNGQKITSVRTYRGCKKSRPHTKVKKRHRRH
jgi:hypothetical protein